MPFWTNGGKCISMINKYISVLAGVLALFLPGALSQAAMTIEIIGGAASRIPVMIAGFKEAGAEGEDPAAVVRADLARSGFFKVLDAGGVPVGENQVALHRAWRERGVDAVVVGQVVPMKDGRVDVRFRLHDAVRESELAAFSYVVAPQLVRATAHRIADQVYEKLTGEPGAFSGRIAYILKRGKRFELQVSDVDGHNAFTVTSSPEPLIGPAWSPDGRKMAYVSFEQKKPVIYVQNLADGKRHALASFRGSNSSPAWSPDGSKLAIVLSKDETSQIYLINAQGGDLRRISSGGALETEPVFSPDGEWLYFTSDRGGSPQIYRAPASGGSAKRMTFEGDYNASPALSRDGKLLAYVHRRDGGFRIASLELATGQTQVLTDTQQDESPSFAPNSRTILYATLVNGRGVLATVSADGRIKQRLSQAGDLREPAWSP
jgi:TolB protein